MCRTMQKNKPLRLSSERGVVAGPSKRNMQRKKSTTPSGVVTTEDPPDQMEEFLIKALRNNSRQRNSSRNVPSAGYSQRRRQNLGQDQKRAGPTKAKSVSPSGSKPVRSHLSSSCPYELSYEPTESDGHHRSRSLRVRSPHPIDMLLKEQAEAKVHTKNERRQKNEPRPSASASLDDMLPYIPGKLAKQATLSSINSTSTNGSANDDELSTFSISSNLQSSESAEELRQLIEAMQNQFKRLHSAKLHAEAKAEKLQTDLCVQQQEMEKHFESLSMENERLKSEANESDIKIGRLMGKVKQLDSENRTLKVENSQLSQAKEVSDAKCIAAILRCNQKEVESMMMHNTMTAIKEKASHY